MADWEEIKRLAADFQRAQLSSTVQKLSERNCIEIVQKLTEFKLLEVVYTTDGKEYLTPQELIKEIREELLVRGGRVNLVDLQATLNVDFSHVEAKVSELVRSHTDLMLVLGQLIDQSYLDTLSEEINDKLQDQGQVTLAELAKSYDLPGDFLSEMITTHLGTVIKGQVDNFDNNIIFTDAFVNRHRAVIRGVFSAITRPTTLSTVINQFDLQNRLFYTVLEDLIASGQLAGSIAGGHQERSQYIPDIYTRAQNEWVDSFYKQNGYLEYDTLTRIGISDAKSFIKKRFKSESLLYLSSCCIGRQLEEQVEAEVEEALATTGWLDVTPLLPSICTTTDCSHLVSQIVRRKPGMMVFCETIIASEGLVSSCQRPFDAIIQNKAETVARTNPGLLSQQKHTQGEDISTVKEEKKEQRRKKATTGKSGGGTQGREVKTKSTKKKTQRGGRDKDLDDSDDDISTATTRGRLTDIEVLTIDSIQDELGRQKDLQDCPPELLTSIAERLHRPLNKQCLELAKSVFIQSAGGATSAARRKTHSDLTEKITSLWMNARLFEKGIKFFSEESQVLLTRHLLKTICSDITNLVYSSVAADHLVSVDDHSSMSHEARIKILSKISEEKVKTVLSKLDGSLNGKSLEDFFTQVDAACCQDVLDIILRKPDKKKERQLVFQHRQALAEQLRNETDPALGLHLAAVILFQVYTQCMIHVPGRCVPQVIGLLKEHMTPDAHGVLAECQDLVVRQLKQQADQIEESATITRQLEELLPKVKDTALTARKGGGAAANED